MNQEDCFVLIIEPDVIQLDSTAEILAGRA